MNLGTNASLDKSSTTQSGEDLAAFVRQYKEGLQEKSEVKLQVSQKVINKDTFNHLNL